MQQNAELAVGEHMKNLQKEFEKENKGNKTAPFRDITKSDENRIIERAMHNSDRWHKMEAKDFTAEEIKKSFDVKTDMRIFSWQGDIDTLMTPHDSILYYKNFLRAGLLSMTPQTGEVKAWVGGINLQAFSVRPCIYTAKRQVGSTFKPFLYATAIDQLHLSPCDTLSNVPYCIPAKGKWGCRRTGAQKIPKGIMAVW